MSRSRVLRQLWIDGLIGASLMLLGIAWLATTDYTFAWDMRFRNALLINANAQVFYEWYWSLIPVTGLIYSFVVIRGRFHFYALLLGSAAYIGVVALLLYTKHWWFPPTASLLGMVLTYLLWSARRMMILLRYVRQELVNWHRQIGDIEMLLPNTGKAGALAHSIEHNITHAQHLSQLVTNSLQNLPVAVLLITAEGLVLMHNKKAADLFGHQPIMYLSIAELIGCEVSYLEGFEWVNGEQTHQVHVVPIHFTNSSGTDISEHVILQVSLIDLSKERAAQRQRNDLGKYLLHDLRVPQVAILSLIDIYKENPNMTSADNLLIQICSKVQDTLDAANDLVHLGQAQDGNYMMMEVNTIALIHNAMSQVWAQASAKNIKLLVDPKMDDWFEQAWVWGDASMLTRALMNILINGLRYSDENSQIHISLKLEQNKVVCLIRDEGHGMTDDQLHALNQGKSLSKTQKSSDRAGSLGIGLHMLMTVTKHHHGHVWFTNVTELGFAHGTLVSVYLPALPVEPQETDIST